LFQKRLGFRIALLVSLIIFTVELGVGFLSVISQKKSIRDQKIDILNLLTTSLEGELSREIQNGQLENLSWTASRISRPFRAYSTALFDPEGKILVHEEASPQYASSWADLKGKLQLTEKNKDSFVEVLHRPQGQVLRYLVPIRNFSEQVVGGIDVEMPLSSIDAAIWSYVLKTMGVVLVVLVFVNLTLTPVLLFFVVRPINEVKNELMALAKGEAQLTYQIKVRSQDEIGQLAFWFNEFIDNIRKLVLNIREHSEKLTHQVQGVTQSTAEVGAMGEDVSTTVQQIARGAEEQATKIGEVNQLMQQTQETAQEVETKAREAAAAVDKAIQTARAGGKMAKNTIEKMSHLNETILANSKVMNRLGDKGQEIGKVVELISGIADQTNLLSLNAAIEAARAGEQGKGFAVVAEEIRALADGATKATKEITQLILEIQEETQAAVESMVRGATEAGESREVIHQMGASLEEIISVVENVVEHSQNISELVALQTQRYNKVVHGIQDINAVSEQSAASTQEVSASTEEQSASMEHVKAACSELTQMAQQLKALVGKFKV
jgi:methyl-accepting chemotaxis protein